MKHLTNGSADPGDWIASIGSLYSTGLAGGIKIGPGGDGQRVGPKWKSRPIR